MGPAGDLEDGAVAFAGGQILAVGPFAELSARFPGAEVTGDGDGVVLPGLVNAHTHLSEALLCGMGEDPTLFEWIDRIGVRRVAGGALVGHDLAELVAASRPLAAELASRAGLGGLSRLARA